MKEEIPQILRELSDSINGRPAWAVLKSHIADIDEVLRMGVKTEAIEKTLAELGLELAPTALRSALYRYRKKQRAENLKPVSQRAKPQGFDSVGQKPRKRDSTSEKDESVTSIETPSPAYKSTLTMAEKEHFKSLTPLEKIEFYRKRAQQEGAAKDGSSL